jgi:hypothetical protein
MSSKLKKQLQGEINFNPLLHERRFIVSPVDQSDIFDIIFMLYGGPARDPLFDSATLSSIEGLRLYINNTNYTAELISELKYLLGKLSIAEIRAQYKKGVDKWLELYTPFSAGRADPAQERIKFQAIQAKQISDWLVKLGDRSVGYLGSLHILNYLYCYIDLEPVSLNNLIKRKYPSADAEIQSVKDLVPITITLSHGPAPSLEPFKEDPKPRGQLTYLIDLIYDNPLYELMKLISTQTQNIQLDLEKQRINYYEPIVNSVQHLQQDTDLKLQEIKKSVDDLSHSIDSFLPKTK